MALVLFGTSVAADFTCGVDCVKTAATLQGADVLTSLDRLQYSMEVTFNTSSDAGVACGQQRRFPETKMILDPSSSVKLTTAHTRVEPSITFECDTRKNYHLVLNDALGGVFQNTSAYTHWLRLNLNCPASGLASIAENGRDMAQGSPAVAGWFSGKGYLFPAFPYNTLHHFNFYLFETDASFSDARLNEIDAKFPMYNQLGNPENPAYTIAQIMAWLDFEAPRARTWMDVTTSYWSKVRMDRLVPSYPAIVNSSFYQLICPCNLPSAQPGLFHAGGDPQCNL